MGCLRLTYQETFTPLNVVYNDLNASDKCFLGGYRYGFQGQEKDDEVKGSGNSYDFGARMHDPRIGRFLSLDRYASNFPHFSPYLFAGNTPIVGIDVNGDSLYILTYTRGKDEAMFKASALTRKNDIEKSSGFDSKRDKVVVIGVSDLSTVKKLVNYAVKNYSSKYGETAEFGMWSHSGLDGPIGGGITSEDALYEGSTQMDIEGWSKIDFNWGDEGGRAVFYGCNSGNSKRGKSFTTLVSEECNFMNVDVIGQSTSSFPSNYVNRRSIYIDEAFGLAYGKNYMVGGNKGEGSKAIFVGTDVNPMHVSKNGVVTDKNYTQPGNKYKKPDYSIKPGTVRHDKLLGGTCFEANTLIWSKEGYKVIQDIEVGDSVWSYNEATKKLELEVVLKVGKYESDSIFSLKYGDLIIKVTKEHPFYVIGKGWLEVYKIIKGDLLKGVDENYKVKEIYQQKNEVPVYNFEVSNNHNYFIGNKRVLVHNKRIKKSLNSND